MVKYSLIANFFKKGCVTRVKDSMASLFSKLKQLFVQENTSAHDFALACAVACYVAISPFVGLHTLMSLGIGWFFDLNIPVLITVSYLINNPFTIVPILVGTYCFGYWFLHSLLEVSAVGMTPAWMVPVNTFLKTHAGLSEISFWAFMVGANLLGILVALITYPVVKKCFNLWRSKAHHTPH